MTIQEKIKQLKTYLSNATDSQTSDEEIESIQTFIEEATKIFELGDISRMDPELIGEVYEKWNTILDSKLSLFSEFKQTAKRHV